MDTSRRLLRALLLAVACTCLVPTCTTAWDTTDGFGEEAAPRRRAKPRPRPRTTPKPKSKPKPKPPPPPTTVSATIHVNPPQPQPGEPVSLWATVTDGKGKTLSGAKTFWDVVNYGGNVDPRFTYQGAAVPIKLTVVYEGREYRFAKTIPAYTATAPPEETKPPGEATTLPPADTAAPSTEGPQSGPAAVSPGDGDSQAGPPAGPVPGLGGVGRVPGPASILAGVVGTVVPGLIGVLGGLIGGLGRTTPPPVSRPPASRPPPPRAPMRKPVPPPPVRAPAKPPPPPPPKHKPRTPAPPPPDDEAKRLQERIKTLEKRANDSGNSALKKWAEDTRKHGFNPDGSVNKEKMGEAKSKLGEALNIPGEAPKGFMGTAKDLAGLGYDVTKGMVKGAVGLVTGGDVTEAKEYAKAGLETGKEFVTEVAGGIKTFVGGVISLPLQVVDGVKVIGKTVRDIEYLGRGLKEMTRDYVNTTGATDRDAFRNAMKEGRYLDALGNLLKGMGNAGLALGGKAWEVAKEFIPADEIASFFGQGSSLGERLWAVPSGIAKTLGLLMGTEGGRNLLSKPVTKLPGWSPLSTTAKGVEAAGKTLGEAAAKKWTEWRGPAKLPDVPPKLTGSLGKLQDTIDDAIRTTDPAEQARKVQQIYRDGGMSNLKKLQEAGGLSSQQAAALNKTITETVNKTVDKSVRGTVGNFHKGTGVRIEEVIVADSGSSAAGGARSIFTDADRTKLIRFNPQDLSDYATKHGLTEAQAYDKLSRMAQQQINNGVGKGLSRAGLSPNDVGYGSYRGLGSGAGPADAYPRSWTEQNVLRQTKATSYRPGSGGGVNAHEIGGRQVLDAGQMIDHKYGGGTLGDAAKTFGDSRKVLAQQAASLSKPNVSMDKVAKAVLRAGQETSLRGRALDQKLLEVAKLIKDNPQGIKQILQSKGLTEEAFRNWGRSAVKGASDWMNV